MTDRSPASAPSRIDNIPLPSAAEDPDRDSHEFALPTGPTAAREAREHLRKFLATQDADPVMIDDLPWRSVSW